MRREALNFWTTVWEAATVDAPVLRDYVADVLRRAYPEVQATLDEEP
jgi:hypothetical protein